MPRSALSPARRSRRLPALLIALGVLVGGLAACGDDEPAVPEGAEDGLSAVEVSGDPGEEPEVAFDAEMGVTETESDTLVEGDGEEVEGGDRVFTHIWVGNGIKQEKSFSTYDAGRPEVISISDQLTPAIREAMVGHTIGSRVAVAATPADAFGDQGNPQLGIGQDDAVLFVVDMLGTVLDDVDGEEVDPKGPTPTLVKKDGIITKLQFPPALRATGKLQVRTLVEGDGEEVGPDSTVAVRYLGQVLGNDTPFDESYSAADPTVFPITGVVKGWTQGLQGVKAGSRVVLVIPPKLGYGKQGQPSAGIRGTDTMVFVIDVLGVA